MRASRRQLLLALAAPAALALAGCASTPKPSLYRVQDPKADLRAYRTFAFYPGPNVGYTSIVQRRLHDAARGELERRGYAFDALDPDLLVNVGGMVQERQALRSAPGNFPGMERLETEDYRQGLLAVDLVDARRQELVWRGVAEGRVGDAMMRDPGTAVEKAVAAIFEGFPVKPVGTHGAAAQRAS